MECVWSLTLFKHLYSSKQAQSVIIIILLKLHNSIILELIRYVNAGAAWLNGAFSKVAKAGQVAGTKTREKWNFALSNLTAKVRFSLFLFSPLYIFFFFFKKTG